MFFLLGPPIGYSFQDKILLTFPHLSANSYSSFNIHLKCHFDQDTFSILHFYHIVLA